ncbi:WD40 repeat domain-containing protein [Paractinoplanes toevensis]|uniref:WD40 repeat domain-containing protein n=1 Tax=Paractinoplanes toevensis TaxID=571911 RepID=A0A920BQS0_9ACTN|nr:PD40 domain-containing protein [Actinoplanes toevensis]GIM97365.1 hypothetical protein Ato02nite_091580 [Actinoplanes toevensis]
MSANLREELRRTADQAQTYDVYAGSVAKARRGRRRSVAAWVLLVAALALAVPFVSRSRPAIPPAGSATSTLPDRLGLPAFGSRGVAGLGAASVVYSGYGGRFGPFFDDADTFALVGAATEDYRTLHTGLIEDGVLLSPDGTVVAIPEQLVDLRTGDQRPLPGVPVAWSPDGRRIVVQGTRLRIVDVTTDATIDLGPADEWTSAAWSPDGRRLAYEQDHRIIVADESGRALGSFVPPGGSVLAGKGAWAPDGRALALLPSETRSWALRWFDPADGREVSGPDLPAIDGEIFGGSLLGWRPDGSALAFVAANQPRLLALTPGTAEPVSAMALPSEVYYLDIADRAIESGQVRAGDPPFFIGPLMWPRLIVGAAGVLVLWWLIRRARERARLRRVVATPWETTHGPLV